MIKNIITRVLTNIDLKFVDLCMNTFKNEFVNKYLHYNIPCHIQSLILHKLTYYMFTKLCLVMSITFVLCIL